MTRSDQKTAHDRPYRAEYARSGGSVCRQCHNHIGQDSLRLAFMADAATRDDARVPQWFHFNCFWKQNRPDKLSDIEGWRDLREGDQALLEEHIHGLHGGLTSEEEGEEEERAAAAAAAARPKKREVSPSQKERDERSRPHTHEAGLKTFSVSYARSGGSRCRACDQNIRQGDIRIGKRDANTHDALVYGPRVQYHHVRCFRDNRYLLDFDDEASIEEVPGFDKLHDNDKRRLAHMLGGGQKHEQPKGGRDSGLGTEQHRQQAGEMMEEKGQKQRTTTSFRPHLAADFKGGSIEAMSPPEQEDIDEAIGEEEEAGRGQRAFVEGQLAEGPSLETRAKTREKREQIIVEEEEEQPMEEGERGAESRTRATSATYHPPPMLESGERPLTNLRFFITGRMQRRSLQEVRDDLERLGATIVPEPDESVVAAVVSDYKARIGAQSTHVRAAMKADVHVVGEDFVDDVVAAAKAGRLVADPASYHEAKNSRSMIWLADLVTRHALVANCGSDVAARIRRSLAAAHELAGGRHLGKSTSVNLEEQPGTGGDEKRLKVTPKLSVDPDSGLEDDAHVFTEQDENKNKCVWSVLLHSVPETSLSNFYYRIQLLESNDNDMWWVYRSWGRVGTAIGSNKLDVFEDKDAAKRNFEQVFEEKTGIFWNNGKFSADQRVTGRYFPIDETEEEEESQEKQEKREGEEKMAID